MLMMIYYYFYSSFSNDIISFREVGVPSRNILHVRGRGSTSRIRVRERHRGADAQKISLKDKRWDTTANFDLLRDPSFLAARMRVDCMYFFLLNHF